MQPEIDEEIKKAVEKAVEKATIETYNDCGLSVEEIVEKTGVSQDEVRCILGLSGN